jgi:Fic family protein
MKELTEYFMKNFVMESDLIENLFFNQTKLLHDYPFNKNIGHFGALQFIARMGKNRSFLTESDIMAIQYLILKEQKIYENVPEQYIGQYRKVNVKIKNTNDVLPHFSKIPSMMKNFIRKVNQWQISIGKHCKEQNMEIIGRFHHMFEKIHPFADGNGRTGRLIALYMILFVGLEPFIFTSADKTEEYYPAFQHRNKMASYFVKKYREEKERARIQTEIKIPYLKSSHQEGEI